MTEFTAKYVAILIMMALDIIGGLSRAISTGEALSSKKMRQGLFHKVGVLMVMIAADVIAWVFRFYTGNDLPIVIPVMIYIITMEAVSIAESARDAGLLDLIRKILKRE